MTEKLKPCPFCGEDAAILDGKSDSCRVRCESCGTEGRPSFFNSDDQDAIDIAEDEARYGWNARTPIQGEPAGLVRVPVKLTERMLIDGFSALGYGPSTHGDVELAWELMLAAAPKDPKP